MGDQSVPNPNGEAGKDTVPKAEHDAKMSELNQKLEDMRLEVFSPEYMEFLDAKDKGKGKEDDKGDKGDKGKTATELSDEELSKLTPKQILEKAKEQAKAELRTDIEAAKKDAVSTVDKETKAREVASFARTHGDFETYRPVMYGLSLDPKNKDLSLQELYDASKAYIKRTAEPSEEEKERQRKLSNEKPGGDNQSFEKYKKMSAEDTAKESLQEVKDKLGPIPQS